MWVAASILLLWAADKHLLSKIWTLIASITRQACWSALTLYSNWRHTNEMIKDGYHVDFVYLYEPLDNNNSSECNEIDLLAHFRDHIRQKLITQTKAIPLSKFIESCCNPNSNFNKYDASKNYELVVRYTFDHKQYIIVYDNQAAEGVRFPIYSEAEIRGRSLKNGGVITAGLLTAKEDDEEGINVYDQLKQLAGPMENFYADTEYKVKRHHLNYAGLKMDVENAFIKMLDFWGTDFVVRPRQNVIKLEK